MTENATPPAPSEDDRSSPVTTADSSAKDKAVEATQVAKDRASAVADTATDAASEVAQETAAQAKDLMGRTRDQLTEQAAAQQSSIVQTLRDLGDQLAGMTDTDQEGTAVDIAATARDHARNAADWLDRREPTDVLEELRELGRRRPGAFLLGAAVAGIAAGRLTRGVVAAHTTSAPELPQQSPPQSPRSVSQPEGGAHRGETP